MKKYFYFLFSKVSLAMLILLTSCNNATEASILTVPTVDMEQYLQKIWVVDGWSGDGYVYPISFYFTSINNELLEGRVRIGAIAIPDNFRYSTEPSKSLGALTGVIENNAANCLFSTEEGNAGKLVVSSNEDDTLTASIIFSEKAEAYEHYSDGTFIFRPYNLSDIANIIPERTQSLSMELDSWGSINLEVLETNSKKVIQPAAFLTDSAGNILYDFGGFLNGSEVIEVIVNDINDDGLKDIIILTRLTEDIGVEIARKFIQMENGLFYSG